jgi:hypothetical protein
MDDYHSRSPAYLSGGSYNPSSDLLGNRNSAQSHQSFPSKPARYSGRRGQAGGYPRHGPSLSTNSPKYLRDGEVNANSAYPTINSSQANRYSRSNRPVQPNPYTDSSDAFIPDRTRAAYLDGAPSSNSPLVGGGAYNEKRPVASVFPQTMDGDRGTDGNRHGRFGCMNPLHWKLWQKLVALALIVLVIIAIIVGAVLGTRANAYPNYYKLNYSAGDTYQGPTFFEQFSFFNTYDPTAGFVQ